MPHEARQTRMTLTAALASSSSLKLLSRSSSSRFEPVSLLSSFSRIQTTPSSALLPLAREAGPPAATAGTQGLAPPGYGDP
eukprot:754931-Hanusia_phi.AAC.4